MSAAIGVGPGDGGVWGDGSVRADGTAKAGDVIGNSSGTKRVVIPAGEFSMGSEETKEALQADQFAFQNLGSFDASDEGPANPVNEATFGARPRVRS